MNSNAIKVASGIAATLLTALVMFGTSLLYSLDKQLTQLLVKFEYVIQQQEMDRLFVRDLELRLRELERRVSK